MWRGTTTASATGSRRTFADDVAGVVGLVQMGVLEIHTWNSDVARVEEPNRLVFDPWKDYWTTRQKLTHAMLKAVGV